MFPASFKLGNKELPLELSTSIFIGPLPGDSHVRRMTSNEIHGENGYDGVWMGCSWPYTGLVFARSAVHVSLNSGCLLCDPSYVS